jgi:hypothetical protein
MAGSLKTSRIVVRCPRKNDRPNLFAEPAVLSLNLILG